MTVAVSCSESNCINTLTRITEMQHTKGLKKQLSERVSSARISTRSLLCDPTSPLPRHFLSFLPVVSFGLESTLYLSQNALAGHLQHIDDVGKQAPLQENTFESIPHMRNVDLAS